MTGMAGTAKAIRWLACVALVAAVSACGGGGGSTATPATTTTTTTTTTTDSGAGAGTNPGGVGPGANTGNPDTGGAPGTNVGGVGPGSNTGSGSGAGSGGTGTAPPPAAAGPFPPEEFRVNTTPGHQAWPVIARLEGGGYVVAWANTDAAGEHNIYLQRYDDGGAKVGAETRVNTRVGTNGFPIVTTPAVTALKDGGYIVSWHAFTDAAVGWDVYAQRYDQAGARVGGETLINSSAWSADFGTAGKQFQSSQAVAGLIDGGYVAIWISEPPAGSSSNQGEVQVVRFDAAGARVWSGNMEGSGPHASFQYTAVASLYSGGFVMLWTSNGTITQMRLDAGGVPVGIKTVVATGTVLPPRIAALWDGGWIVTFSHGNDIYAQRYDSSGTPVGSTTLVNTTTLEDQFLPAAHGLPDGGWVVTWRSWTDGSGTGIYAQRFDAQGRKVGGETLVNTPAGNQNAPDVVGDNLGGSIAVWHTFDSNDPSRSGIYARRVAAP